MNHHDFSFSQTSSVEGFSSHVSLEGLPLPRQHSRIIVALDSHLGAAWVGGWSMGGYEILCFIL